MLPSRRRGPLEPGGAPGPPARCDAGISPRRPRTRSRPGRSARLARAPGSVRGRRPGRPLAPPPASGGRHGHQPTGELDLLGIRPLAEQRPCERSTRLRAAQHPADHPGEDDGSEQAVLQAVSEAAGGGRRQRALSRSVSRSGTICHTMVRRCEASDWIQSSMSAYAERRRSRDPRSPSSSGARLPSVPSARFHSGATSDLRMSSESFGAAGAGHATPVRPSPTS